MMLESPHDHREPEPSAEPLQLAAGLRELYRQRIEIPRSADEAIRCAIQDHFALQARRPRWGWRALPWTAAAVVGIAVWLAMPSTTRPSGLAVHAPADIDRNGRIDILDAFALARRLQSSQSQSLDPGVDLNRDGVVDSSDVDVIAMQAVSLGAGASS